MRSFNLPNGRIIDIESPVLASDNEYIPLHSLLHCEVLRLESKIDIIYSRFLPSPDFISATSSIKKFCLRGLNLSNGHSLYWFKMSTKYNGVNVKMVGNFGYVGILYPGMIKPITLMTLAVKPKDIKTIMERRSIRENEMTLIVGKEFLTDDTLKKSFRSINKYFLCSLDVDILHTTQIGMDRLMFNLPSDHLPIFRTTDEMNNFLNVEVNQLVLQTT